MESYPQTSRNQLKQAKQRGSYNRQAIHAVLDAAPLCHVGFTLGDQPFVIPMVFSRDGDTLYLHGGVQSRLMRQLATGIEACVCVSVLDGFVMARSAFHHSMNYRSVVLFGRAQLLQDEAEKQHALNCITDHSFPGRSEEVRAADATELSATHVVRLAIREATLKQRQGDPVDNRKDLERDCWAGVVPVRSQLGQPVAAADLDTNIVVSNSIKATLATQINNID